MSAGSHGDIRRRFHGRNPAMPLEIHFERAGRAQQSQPLNIVERSADVGNLWAAASATLRSRIYGMGS